MRLYELMAIFPLDDEKSKTGGDKLREVLTSFGAEIEKEEKFGDRDLAYEIEKQKRGRFMLYTLKINPDKLVDVDNAFKLNENLLRYLFVRLDERKVS